MDKMISIERAIAGIKDGMTLMVGGFLGNGTPSLLVDALAASGVKNLTLVCNDTAFPDKGVGKLIANRQARKVYTSHIGTNPLTGEQMNAGELDVEFCPQGTLAERVRAGGNGLGGVLTPTGLGTMVADGKRVIAVDGREFLLETPLRADVALIRASVADRSGNLAYRGTAENFNPLMATAADVVIAEAGEMVETGQLAPEHVRTPGILVHGIVAGEPASRRLKSTIRVRMSAHDAHYGGELVDGARLLQLFGDVATELLILHDGDEGLFAAYDSVEFLAPVHAGDYVEATGEITRVGNTSRRMTFEARKVIAPRPELSPSAAEALAAPVVVCRASGTCVVPKQNQRKWKS
jgi:acetate CoA/acetoacetate CoA-transferase alpha subunit